MQSTLALRPIEAAHATVLSAAFAAIGWSKPASIFEQYFEEQSQGCRWVRVAHRGAEMAGYITLVWDSNDPVLREAGIPEIVDLNVLPQFRRQGIGSALLDAAEAEAASRGDRVGLRVGLHSGYGAAQRLYVRRGYLPDGAGALIDGSPALEHATVVLDDDLTLRMIKVMAAPAAAGL